MVSEVMRFVGGSLIPFAGLMQLSLNGITVLSDKTSQVGLRKIVFEKNGTDAKEYLKLRKTVSALFPLDCSMNYMMNLEAFYQKMFPLQQGLLTITQGEQEICCPVALEPISCSQKYLTAPVRIIVKGAVKDWDLQRTGQLSTHAWILQRAKQKDIKETYFLHQLLKEIIYNNINVVVEVEANNYLPPSTGILSPLLSGTAMLTLISWEQEPEFEELFLQTELTESSQVMASEVLDIVSKALNLFSDITECQTCSEVTVPDWAQAELAETSQQRASFGEGWFPLSELSGASSTLMESIGSMSGEDEKVNMDSEVVLSGHLAEFYQRKSADEAGAVIEHGVKKRQCGPRTPIRQKMRSMSRSLQMLNVARLNLKAQKSQPDGVQLPIGDESTHQPKKSLGGKQKTRRMRKSTVDFKSDEEMVSSLKENYQKHVADDELSQFSFIQNAVKVIKMHLKSSNTEAFEATCINLIQMQLLKSSKSIRQQYGNQENKELKVRDCQLQVLLHLEMFQQFPTLQSDPEQLELLVEEMTNLLRIISLTKDTTFLAKFLEEEILNMYLLSIPKILGELYFGLGQNVPARLASVLPADFLSDESMSQKTESPDAPQLTLLATSTSFADCEGEQLEELRTRSSRKRRNLPLMRHRSMSEVSHNLRQIQIPKKSMKLQENIQSHAPIATEQAVLPPQPSQKEAQEVTKVRRNLFNRENSSPRKKSKMPKSYSESVVEGVRHLHGEQKANKGHRKLLTRKVTETPLHKQVSHRLLDKQIRGRCSETDSDVSIVKESPERARFTDLNLHTRKLRRSPRIRNVSLARTHSSSFYSGSCSVSRSLERVQSMSHIQAGKAKRTGNQIIRSPNRLLFGAVRGLVSPKEKRSSKASCLDSDCLSAVQSPKPTPDNSPSSPNKDRAAQKSPQTSRYLTPGKKARSSKSPTTRNPINDYLIKESSPWKMTTNSQFQSPRRSERLNKGVANKSILAPKMEVQSSFRSPLMVSGHLLLSSPDTDNLSVKPSPRRSECLSSPCRNSSTVNIPSNTVESASQVKSSRKGLSVLNSPVRISEKLLPSYSINNLAKDKSSTSCAPRNMKLRKSKSDESFISRTPKICTCRSLKRNADTSCSSDQSKSQKSSASAACTLTSIWKVSFQTPQQTSVMTRSMHSVSAPDRLCAMRYKSPERDGLHVTTSKFEMQTPPKHNSTPLKNPVRTRSMFNVTPMQSGLKTPSKYTSPPPKCPVRTRSMFATPLKSELKTPSKFTATSPKSPVRTRSMFIVTPSKIEMTDTSTRIGTCLNVAHSKVDQKLLSKCNSTPLKSPVMTRSQSTLSSTPPYLKTPPRTMSELNITSKREESTVSKSRPLLRAAPRSVTRNEPDVESMKMPGNCATSKMQLDRMLKTPEKSKSTICNLQKKFPKSHRAFSTSNLEEERALQEPNLQMSIPQIKIEVPDTRARFVTDQNISLSWSAATYDNLGNLGEDCFNAVVGLSASDSLSRSSQSTVSNVDLIAEKLDSSLTSAADSGVANAQAEESSDISQVRLIQSESSGLKMKFAVLRRESDSSVSNSVDAAKFPSIPNKSTTYEFRWTPDRRQRLAAAQQQIPEFPKKISTPKGRNWPPMPTYEVELEMQDSGLPKLRFKRTNSSMVVSPPLEHSVIKISDNPCVCVKKRGCESPLGKRNAQRCVKHSGKTEGGPISPSFCFHSSHNTPAKATPRKGGVQTYICQSYTPTQYSSNTSSPSQPDLGLVPWTPSPTHKIRPSQTPDTIKNWPRKKKAATTPLGGKWQKGYPATMQKEDNFYTEHYSNKAVSLEEIGMEGVSRLQDHSPTIEWDRRFPASPEEKFGLRSRKRGCSFISPTSEDEKAAQKRRKSNFIAPFSETEFAQKEVQKEKSPSGSFSPCKIFTWRSFEDDVVFDCPAVASPSCKVKSTLSASGLLALTQSPLLYAGTTPKKRPGTRDIMYEDMQTDSSASKRKAIVGEIDQDCSPFTKAPVRRCITKTYSRKKLVS